MKRKELPSYIKCDLWEEDIETMSDEEWNKIVDELIYDYEHPDEGIDLYELEEEEYLIAIGY